MVKKIAILVAITTLLQHQSAQAWSIPYWKTVVIILGPYITARFVAKRLESFMDSTQPRLPQEKREKQKGFHLTQQNRKQVQQEIVKLKNKTVESKKLLVGKGTEEQKQKVITHINRLLKEFDQIKQKKDERSDFDQKERLVYCLLETAQCLIEYQYTNIKLVEDMNQMAYMLSASSVMISKVMTAICVIERKYSEKEKNILLNYMNAANERVIALQLLTIIDMCRSLTDQLCNINRYQSNTQDSHEKKQCTKLPTSGLTNQITKLPLQLSLIGKSVPVM